MSDLPSKIFGLPSNRVVFLRLWHAIKLACSAAARAFMTSPCKTSTQLIACLQSVPPTRPPSRSATLRKFKTAPISCKDVSMFSNQKTACAQSINVCRHVHCHIKNILCLSFQLHLRNYRPRFTPNNGLVYWCSLRAMVPRSQVPPALLYKDETNELPQNVFSIKRVSFFFTKLII